MKIPAKGFTHGGKFHADDVFSTALLQILRPDIQITRGFTVPDDFDGIVYDVGGGMFDHHSEPRETRPNGVPYAAFGLLWRVLGAQLVGEHQARLLDENFIQPLDLNDNTGEQNSLADAIGSFNPLWDSKDDPDACFWRAVPVARQILENEIAAANAVNRADDTVRQAYANMRDGIVVLPAYMPWMRSLWSTPASAAATAPSASMTTAPSAASSPSRSRGPASRRSSCARSAASACASATPAGS